MRRVYFENIETCLGNAACRLTPHTDQVLDLGIAERTGFRVALAARKGTWSDELPCFPIITPFGCFRQRSPPFPGAKTTCLSSGMAKLNGRHGVVRPDEIGKTPEMRDKLIVPETGIANRPATAAVNFGRFDKHQPGATRREPPDIHQVPIRRKAIFRRVLMHWRHDNAIF